MRSATYTIAIGRRCEKNSRIRLRIIPKIWSTIPPCQNLLFPRISRISSHIFDSIFLRTHGQTQA